MSLSEKQVSKIFKANFLPAQRILDKKEGRINIDRRKESFNDCKEWLFETDQITEKQFKEYEYKIQCECGGCKNNAEYELTQKTNKNAFPMYVCECCLPSWAKENEELSIMGFMEVKHYVVTKIEGYLI